MNHVAEEPADQRSAEQRSPDPKSSLWKRFVRSLGILYLIALLVAWGCIHFHTRSWWPVTLFLFSPRWTVAVPLLFLVPLTLVTHFRWIFLYLLHGVIIAFCILGYRVAWERQEDAHNQPVLRVLTCNLGGGTIDTTQLADLAATHNIHVLLLQECPPAVSDTVFHQLGWDHRQELNVAIGSSLNLGELQVLARQSPANYNAIVAVSCEVCFPSEPLNNEENALPESRTVRLVNVHLPTFREALAKARRLEWGAEPEFTRVGAQYTEAAEQVHRQIDKLDGPVVIAGDFNAPVESVYYRDYWSTFQNAFTQAGTGFGHTKETRYHGVRIDHVLADNHWNVASATVAAGFGGDHRPVLVELSLNR